MKKKMLVLRSLLIVFIFSVSLLGCGKEEVEVAEVPEVETETESAKEEQVVEEETTSEEETENVEAETQNTLTVEEWLDSLNTDEVFFTIWNENTHTGRTLEQGERYEMQPGDSIYLHSTVNIISIKGNNYTTATGKIGEHIPFEFTGNFPGETSVDIIFETEDGEKYEVKNTFYDESIATASTSENHELTGGRAWAQTLESAEPELLVWNDDTGMQKELQNGEEYQIQDGDVIAVLFPEGYTPYEVYPSEMFRAFLLGDGYVVIDYNPIEVGETVEFKVALLTSDHQKVYVNCILTK